LDEKSAKMTKAAYSRLVNICPKYMQEMFDRLDFSRAGCQVIASIELGFHHRLNWWDIGSVEKLLSEGSYRGIVLNREDVQCVVNLPGFVTDLQLQPYQNSLTVLTTTG
uniref:hypothetical protein n=1 Tax=Flavobacterium sp. TaxID=239 RepID=UPI0037BF29CF